MKANGYLKVRNYEKFQHYKDRNPPWIKLYYELLDNEDFLTLHDASKMHLIGIWLLASRFQNRVPMDAQWIGNRIGANQPIDFPALISSGFLEHCDASSVLAPCKQSAMPETEEETEKREEKKGASAPSPAFAATLETAGDDPALAGRKSAAAKTTKRKPKSKPAEDARPEHAEVREFFRARWKAINGSDYPWDYGKDDTLLKRVLDHTERDSERAKATIDAFLEDEDQWLRDRGHAIRFLLSNLTRYLARQARPPADDNGFVRAPVTDELLSSLNLPPLEASR